MPEKTKIPQDKVFGDELAIEKNGATYYPHVGEYVVFKGGNQTLGEYVAGLKASHADDVSTEAAQKPLMEVLQKVCDRIVEWNWTNNDGDAYPEKPTPDILLDLEWAEVSWLTRGGRPNITPLVSESPSTKPSTA